VFPLPSILVMIVDGTLMPLTSVDSLVTPHLSLLDVYLFLKLRLNVTYVGQLYDFGDYSVNFFPFLFVVYKSCSLRS
jgi:hypothetical protein